jgi:hypothetical protein
MFGVGVRGTRLGSDIPQTRHGQNTSPNARSDAVWGTVWGDAARDALSQYKFSFGYNKVKDQGK